MERIKKFGKPIGYVALVVLAIMIMGSFIFQFLTEYIWMDSLGFEKVFTTILANRILLSVIGFLLFAVGSFITLSWIRRSYMSHFDPRQLPKIMLNRKAIIWSI